MTSDIVKVIFTTTRSFLNIHCCFERKFLTSTRQNITHPGTNAGQTVLIKSCIGMPAADCCMPARSVSDCCGMPIFVRLIMPVFLRQ